jgi:hypothetical protein
MKTLKHLSHIDQKLNDCKVFKKFNKISKNVFVYKPKGYL